MEIRNGTGKNNINDVCNIDSKVQLDLLYRKPHL